MFLFILLSCIVILSYVVLKPKIKKPPILEGAWPIVGHALMFLKSPEDLWTEFLKISEKATKVGGVITVRIIGLEIYVIVNPEDANILLTSALEKDQFYEFLKPWLGEGLITGTVPIWKQHRKLLCSAFNPSVLESFLGQFNCQARALVNALSAELGKGKFDHGPYTEHAGLETICSTNMGIVINETEKKIRNEYMLAKNKFQDGVVKRSQTFWLHFDFIYNFTNLRKKQDELATRLHTLGNTVIRKRKNVLKDQPESIKTSNKNGFKPFLDLLLDMEKDGRLTEKDVQEEVDTFTFTGSDSISQTLGRVLLLVGTYVDVQEKIYNELEEVFQGSNRDVEKQDLARLKYLEAVVKESLRLHSIVPLIGRILDKDVKLKNYTLPVGSRCYVFLQGVNIHPAWGDDARQFRPERWLESELPQQLQASFGFGRRRCIGINYSLMCVKTMLVHVFRHYQVSGDVTELVQKMEILARPVSKPYLTIQRRKET